MRACDCGAVEDVCIFVVDAGGQMVTAQVRCCACGRRGPRVACGLEADARSAAIARWNERPEEDALRTLLDRARDMLTNYPPHYEDYGGDCYCGPCAAKWPGNHADDCEYVQLMADIDAALEVKA